MNKPSERRQHERLSTEVDVFFQLFFDVKAQVQFQVIDKEMNRPLSRKYLALSRNISLEGLCFSCLKQLTAGELLLLEISGPQHASPVKLKGEVRWSRKMTAPEFDDNKFDTGVKILTVNDRPVAETFVRDENNQVVWSAVLESVMGSYKKK